MRSSTYPYLVSGQTVTAPRTQNTKSPRALSPPTIVAQPDFQLKRTERADLPGRPRRSFSNVTFYVGKVPIFWWPYLYQPLDQSFSYAIAPAYLSSWGPSLLGKITFPIGEKISSTIRLDYRTRRGEALGFDSDVHYGKDDKQSAQAQHLLPAGSESRN